MRLQASRPRERFGRRGSPRRTPHHLFHGIDAGDYHHKCPRKRILWHERDRNCQHNYIGAIHSTLVLHGSPQTITFTNRARSASRISCSRALTNRDNSRRAHDALPSLPQNECPVYATHIQWELCPSALFRSLQRRVSGGGVRSHNCCSRDVFGMNNRDLLKNEQLLTMATKTPTEACLCKRREDTTFASMLAFGDFRLRLATVHNEQQSSSQPYPPQPLEYKVENKVCQQ